ncbi:MAG TPA: PAS domain S-box protein [Anaeromyxobacteraceae bacterium]|nr:PAS domain S-box protein [Anaeromyxobacteraceae bacterium]
MKLAHRSSGPAKQRPDPGTFRALADHAPDSIDRIDRQFRHVYLNEAGARLVGRKPHEVVGRTNRELGVPAPIAQLWEDRIARVFETGEPLVVDDVFPTTEGDRFFETSCVPELDSRGRVRTVLTVSRETTRRRRAEEELRRLESIVDAFFAASPALLIIQDDEFRLVMTDPITPTYFGLDRASIAGRFVEELAPDFIRNFGPMMREVVETGRPRLDLEVSNPSAVIPGKTYHWRASYFPVRLPEGGRGIGIVGIDVTETKEKEVALREAHERLSAAVDAADAGIWEWVLATNENTWSERLWGLYGLAPGSGTPSYALWASTIHPDDRPGVEAAVFAAARDATPVVVEWRVKSDGPTRWLMSRGKPILDAHGRVTRMIGVVTDVTARKTAEAARAEFEKARAVQASEERYRSVLAAMSEGVIRLDASGTITDSNPAAERILGLTAGQMAGRTSIDPRWRAIREDGSPFPGEFHPSMVALRTGTAVRDVVMGVHRPDDGLAWILISAEPVRGPDGAVEAVVSTFLDITSRKAAEDALARSEARFRTMAEHAPVGIIQTDAAGHVVYANDRAVTLTGLTRDAVLGIGWLRAVHPEDAERIARSREATDFPGNVRTAEWRFVWPDGKVMHVRSYRSPQRDEAGRLAGSIGIIVDVTEARTLREQLTISSRLAALGTLAAGLSHEMNNPLAAVLSSVAFAEEDLRRLREVVGAPTPRMPGRSRVRSTTSSRPWPMRRTGRSGSPPSSGAWGSSRIRRRGASGSSSGRSSSR